MRLTLLIYHLYLPACHSLKEKRSIIKGLKERIKRRSNVSLAEVEYQEKWQRSTIAITWVSSDGSEIERTIAYLDKLFNLQSELQVLKVERQYIR